MIATVIIIIDNRILPILISLVYEIGNFFYLLALETGGQLFVYTIDFIALVNLRKYINLYQQKIKDWRGRMVRYSRSSRIWKSQKIRLATILKSLGEKSLGATKSIVLLLIIQLSRSRRTIFEN